MRLSHLFLCLSTAAFGACGGSDDEPLETGTEATGDTSAEETGDTDMGEILEAKAEVDLETLFQVDVGHVDPPGEHWIDGDMLSMISQTGDIWGNTEMGEVDHFRFGHLLYQDDVTVHVVLDSLEAAEPFAKAGLMFRRHSQDPGSPNVALVYSREDGVSMQWRDAVETVSVQAKEPVTPGAPVYIRLTRTDLGTFLGEYSLDEGESWQEVGRVVLEGWEPQIYTGVVVSSGQIGSYAQGNFRELSILGQEVSFQ